VADVLGDRLVVGDKQIERSELTLQVAQQVKHLCPTETSAIRLGWSARAGDAAALTPPAREFVREAVDHLGSHAHLEGKLGGDRTLQFPTA
jgi:hypothetical protein